MQTSISAQGFELTEAIKAFALENIEDSLSRIWSKSGSLLEIHLSDLRGPKGGLDQECRVIFYMPGGPKFVITEVTEDMRKSIHQARKRLLRRVRKFNSARTDGARRHRKHFLADVTPKGLVTRPPKSRDVPNAHEVRQ